MCHLTPEQRKVLVAGLTMAEHFTLTAARIDYRANRSRNWKRFFESAHAARTLRGSMGLPAHRYVPKCCAPDELDPQGAIAAYAVVNFGINPAAVDEALEDRAFRTPPRKAKNRAEAEERIKASDDRRKAELEKFYEGAIG